jgi:hypothetical protein
MSQSAIINTTTSSIINRAEAIIDRPLTYMENALVEYAVGQVRLALAETA